MNPRARICIVTPGALGSNPRVVKEADALDAAGYRVTVISTRTVELVDARDADVLAAAKWQSLRLDFRTRGSRSFHRLVQAGCATVFAKTGSRSLADWGCSVFARPLAIAARRVPADLYIAHYPAALPAAAVAARMHGGRYAFDAEDFHPGDYPESLGYESHRRIVRAIEGRHLPGCAYVTAASPGIADAYATEYRIGRPAVVLNVFPPAQAPPAPTLAGSATPGPSVYWFSQTIGPDRGLECAVRAIGRARSKPHLYLRGSPAAGFCDRLRAIALEANASDRIHFLAPASPSDMVRLACAYDIGLAGETGDTPNHRIALSNKLFTYLLAGVPTVMSDIPAHRAIGEQLNAAGLLYTAEDHESLANRFDELLEDSSHLRTARATAFRLGQERFNWDVERSTLIQRVRAATASPAGVLPC